MTRHRQRPWPSAGVLLGAAAVVLAACGQSAAPETPSTPAASSTANLINPARIDRVRAELPAGYEIAEIDRRATPVSLWGFGPDWMADPAHCATVAAPAVDPATARGWSASGSGGIVYAVVAHADAPPDPGSAEGCGQWTVSGGHATGTVEAIAAPAIDGAVTAAMTTAVTTVVEGGTETRSHAETFTADLGDYHCFVTLITDPGSPNPPLSADFAGALLVKTVSALRG